MFSFCLLNSLSQSHGGEGAAWRGASFCGKEGWTDWSKAFLQNTRRSGCTDHPPPGSLPRHGLLLLSWVHFILCWTQESLLKRVKVFVWLLFTNLYSPPEQRCCWHTLTFTEPIQKQVASDKNTVMEHLTQSCLTLLSTGHFSTYFLWSVSSQ